MTLKDIRKKSGKSQADVANKLNFSVGKVHRIESGSFGGSFEDLRKYIDHVCGGLDGAISPGLYLILKEKNNSNFIKL